MTRIRFAMLVGLLAALMLGPAAAASASSTSLGSVPADVATYVSDGSMVARLNDIYGKNAAGTAGISFDATTQAGPISRVYEWTADRLANKKTDHPVQLTNNWVVPITIGGKPVGLATIWINPQSVDAELAQFDPTPALATALASVPATAALVRDPTTHAWLALSGATITPLVAGTSGLSGPQPVDSLKLASSASAPAVVSSDPNTGLAVAIVVVALVVVLLLVVLFLPRGRKRTAVPSGAGVAEDAVPAEAAVPAKAAVPAEAVPVAVAPAAVPVPGSAAEPPRTRAPRSTSGTPVTKPATSKPRAGTAPSAAASTKPRVQKPPAQKPTTQKPTAQNPTAQKPPAQQPPAQRPSAAKPKPKPQADPEGPDPDA